MTLFEQITMGSSINSPLVYTLYCFLYIEFLRYFFNFNMGIDMCVWLKLSIVMCGTVIKYDGGLQTCVLSTFYSPICSCKLFIYQCLCLTTYNSCITLEVQKWRDLLSYNRVVDTID